MDNILFTNRLPHEIYQEDPFRLVKHVILGSYLCSFINGELTAGKITEAEVYLGADDKAAHACGYKKTPRTAVQFLEGGYAYTFLIYGMYDQFCITTSPAEQPDTILIRAVEPVAGIETMQQRRKTAVLKNLTTGPGKLCQALGITKHHNGESLNGPLIWLSPRQDKIRLSDIAATPRIGIDGAGDYRDKPWRFVLKDSPYLSR